MAHAVSSVIRANDFYSHKKTAPKGGFFVQPVRITTADPLP
jgi:hypothetical protein